MEGEGSGSGSQRRSTGLETNCGESGKSELTIRRPSEARAAGRKAGNEMATNLTSCGSGVDRTNGTTPELRETEQQLRSCDLWNGQIVETEGWANSERIPSGGQQLWCEGEGSGL